MQRMLLVNVLILALAGCGQEEMKTERGQVPVGEFEGQPIYHGSSYKDYAAWQREQQLDSWDGAVPAGRALFIKQQLRDMAVARNAPRETADCLEEIKAYAAYYARSSGMTQEQVRAELAHEKMVLRELKDGSDQYPKWRETFPTTEDIEKRRAELEQEPPEFALFCRVARIFHRRVQAARALFPDRQVVPPRDELPDRTADGLPVPSARSSLTEKDWQLHFAVMKADTLIAAHLLELIEAGRIKVYDPEARQFLILQLEQRAAELN